MNEPRRSLLETLKECAQELSTKQRLLANYLLQNSKQAAFMNSRELARKTGVSNSTVLRLASTLGYPRFADFQEDLQKLITQHVSSLDRYTPAETNGKNLLGRIASLEISITNKMIEGTNPQNFQEAVDLLSHKAHILVVGYEGDAFAAGYAAATLQIIRGNVTYTTSGPDAGLSDVIEKGDNTVALVYQFPRYYSKTTRLVSFLKRKGVSVIGITDSILSPLAHYADPLLFVPTKYNTFIDPNAATMTLTHALATGVLYSDKTNARKNIKRYYELTKNLHSCDLEDIEIIVGN